MDLDLDPYCPWWETKGKEETAHSIAKTYERFLNEAQGTNRFGAYRTFLSVFLNRDISAEESRDWLQTYERDGYSRVPFPFAKMVADMVQNRIAKMRPRPKFLPRGGNYSSHQKAKLLERWIHAVFRWNNVYDHAQEAFQDALIYGTGVLKVWREGPKVCTERVYPGELFVDEVESYYKQVRQLIHRRYISRRVLAAQFPKFRAQIMEAPAPSTVDEEYTHHRFGDQVEVLEAWHLPSGEDAGDGRHVIAVRGCTLLDEEWVHDDFPFLIVRWSRNPRSWFGIGLVEELVGIHLDINFTLDRIQEGIELIVPQIWMQNSSGVKTSKITNIVGQVNTYTGNAPIFSTPAAVSPEILQYVQSQIQRGLNIARLSETSIGQKTPAGLETGKAVTAWNDIESAGFQIVAQQYEQLFVALAEWYVRFGKEAYEEDNKFTVIAARDKHTVEEIPWKKVDPKSDSFLIEVQPVSSMHFHLSGRIDQVQSLIQMGLVDPTSAGELLNLPDIDRKVTLERAAEEAIEKILEDIRDEGKYTAPEPFMDAALCLKMGQAAVNEALRMGLPEKRRALLLKFVRSAHALLIESQAQVMDPMGADPGGPPAPGPGGAPPTAVPGGEGF